MNTWRVILATLVIFGAGVVTGGLLVSYVDNAQPRHRRAPSSAGPSEPGPHAQPYASAPRESARLPNLPNPLPQVLRRDFLQNLDHEVRLTADQRERIEKIMSDGQERARDLWERIAPEMRTGVSEVRERILAVLTPEQRGKFEALMKKQRPRDGRRPSPPHEGARPQGGQPSPPPVAPAGPPPER